MTKSIKQGYLLCFFCLMIFFLFSSVKGQNNTFKEYVYTNFTTQEGLPSNEVYTIFQDSKGYIWIGTDRGVSRYDGYTFQLFTTQDGLTDNNVFGIAEDSKGNIWFTTSNRTLCYFTLGGQIEPYEFNEVIDGLPENLNFCRFFDNIEIDSNDVLYISHYLCGFIRIPLNNPDQINAHIFLDKDLISLKEEVLVYRDSTYQNVFFNTCLRKEGTFILSINHDEKYNIKADFGQFGHRCYMLNDSMFSLGKNIYTIGDNDVSNRSFPKVMNVFSSGKKFAVNKVNDSKGEVFLVDDMSKLSEGIRILDIPVRLTDFVEDNNGGYWLSTLEKGVFYIPSLFYSIVEKDKNVSILLPYKTGILYGERNIKFKYLEYGENIQKIVGDIYIDSIKTNMEHSIRLSHPISFNEINSWVFGMNTSHGQFVYNILAKENTLYFSRSSFFNSYTKDNGFQELYKSKNLIQAIEFIDNNTFYLGSKDGIYLCHLNEIRYSLPDIKLISKPRDLKWFKKHKILAVATLGEGVLFYKGNKLIKTISVKDGLVSNSVTQLLLDENERLWVGTNRGISYLEIDENDSIHVNNFVSSSRKLLSPNVQQMYILNDSILFVGTDKGLNEINLNGNNKWDNQIDFPLFITGVKVNKKKNLTKRMPYDNNNIEFEFTALEYSKFGDIEYRYRLKGLSKEWVYTKERKANFLQLPSGDYLFELQAQNERGEWVSLKESPSFTIEKPYWETWWFRLLIVGIIGYIIYYYVSNLKREKSLLEDKQILSGELNESRQKALSAQLNPHFVFNSLNSIQNFILTRRTELSSDYLSMFSKLMRFVFENSRKLYVPLSDEVEALRLYLELEQVRHSHKFEYKINIDCIYPDKVYMPSLLVQPIIENAIWHGLLHKKEDDRVLEVNFTSDTEYLYIDVRDNGVGRGGSKPRPKFIKKQKSSGVELTQQRLSLLTQSSGLKTDFKIVDLFDNNGNQSGTLVRITIPINLEKQ